MLKQLCVVLQVSCRCLTDLSHQDNGGKHLEDVDNLPLLPRHRLSHLHNEYVENVQQISAIAFDLKMLLAEQYKVFSGHRVPKLQDWLV